MKYILMLSFLLIIGCQKRSNEPYKKPIVNKKYCISECRTHEFKNFHNNGKSWGTGSSSMGGLTQGQIYDRVTKECQEFYKDITCCKESIHYNELKTHLHGYEFGECK